MVYSIDVYQVTSSNGNFPTSRRRQQCNDKQQRSTSSKQQRQCSAKMNTPKALEEISPPLPFPCPTPFPVIGNPGD